MKEVLLLGAQKIVGGWGEGVLHGAGKRGARPGRREKGVPPGAEEAPVWPLPAGGRDGPLRCDCEEEAKSGRGGKELRAH